MTKQITVRAVGGHEFLALLPQLAGTSLRRSLVCVAFRGSTVIGVLRHDLPRRMADHPVLVAAVVGAVCRIEQAEGVIVTVYTDREYPRSAAAAERRLIERASARLEDAGFEVRDGFIVASTGWGSVVDPTVPVRGRELELIDAAAAELPVLAGLAEEPPPPSSDRARAARLRRRLVALREQGSIEWLQRELGGQIDPIELVERLLHEPAATAAQGAWFAELSASAVFRDAIVLQIAFGTSVGEIALQGVAGFSATGHDAADASLLEASGGSEEFVTELYLGRTRLRPERKRVEAGIEFVERLLVDLPRSYRPGVHCVAGWLHWALGRGSRAGSHLDRALEIDPDHAMARLLDTYLGSGALPEWAFVREDERRELLGGR
ncbi:DUF4192 family protein [Agromyces sp. NBRC 114283]|jgi:hypothetical protein|uniref:DUF4192 family protein n=1 Tax=Agromyces sp. NBRC 114283 TaxID=2994521 RepID=UPI0024A32708|nr:DUF4192 family protein [Agromyces sp. NBRC 114283]GLU90514.1 hypothetical protein Agsp01_27690 [Agromyces sp. NBRC 114283]